MRRGREDPNGGGLHIVGKSDLTVTPGSARSPVIVTVGQSE